MISELSISSGTFVTVCYTEQLFKLHDYSSTMLYKDGELILHESRNYVTSDVAHHVT